jgi:hypothetical protein
VSVSLIGEGNQRIQRKPLLQSISPALVETEFTARMHKDEERANNLYSNFKVILI